MHNTGQLMRRLPATVLMLMIPFLPMAQDAAPQETATQTAAPEQPATEDPPSKPLVIGALEESPGLEPLQREKKTKSKNWERFRLGANMQLMSSFNEIRSKSANSIVYRNIQINTGEIRFEPRVEDSGRISVNPIREGADLGFAVNVDIINDPRKDEGALQDNAIQPGLLLSLNAAYDIKTWRHGTLFLQLDGSYMSSDVGGIEVAVDIAEQAILNPVDQDLTADDPFANYQYIFPDAGTLVQTPIALSGIWQFRPRSPFRPYVGVGVGYMFTNLKDSPSLIDLNNELRGIEYKWEARGEVISQGTLGFDADGNEAAIITARSTSEWMWTAQGGLEYNVNRNWSMYFSATLFQTPASVQMAALGYKEFGDGIDRNDQINDVDGIASEDDLVRAILSLPVDEAVELIADINDVSTDQSQNERSYYTTYPVELGTPVEIELPNPTNPSSPTQINRQSKLFVHAGDIRLDSFSVGLGFRYRY
jgi:outer membrane protein W